MERVSKLRNNKKIITGKVFQTQFEALSFPLKCLPCFCFIALTHSYFQNYN